MSFSFIVAYIVIGAMSGFLAGLFGIGGGILVVPFLLTVFQHDASIPSIFLMQMASGSSLAIMSIIVPVTLRVHSRYQPLPWKESLPWFPFIIFGTMMGSVIADFMPTNQLKIFFGIFLWIIIYRMFQKKSDDSKPVAPLKDKIVITFISFFSAMIGIGGGTLILSYLDNYGMDFRRAASITAICTWVVALTGTLLFMMTGFRDTGAIPYAIGYVYWPSVVPIAAVSLLFARTGTIVSYQLSQKTLRYALMTLLMLLSIYMFYPT